jgi:hypothetical protein
MMVCKTQYYWVFGLCPSFDILKNWKYKISETGCFHPQVRGETPTPLGPSERANLNGLCPSSKILKTRKHNVSETGSVSILR